VITEGSEPREELFELHFPVEQDTGGDDLKFAVTKRFAGNPTKTHDEMRTPDTPVASEVRQECNRLDRFAARKISTLERFKTKVERTPAPSRLPGYHSDY
jgi:hypothetical protein